MAPDSGTFVMLKEFTPVWIFWGFDSCQVLQQSQVISIYQARTRNGFRKNQGDELLSIQFISCHPSWHLHLSSSTAENQRLVVLPLKNLRRKPYPLKVKGTVKAISNGLWNITIAAEVKMLIDAQSWILCVPLNILILKIILLKICSERIDGVFLTYSNLIYSAF